MPAAKRTLAGLIVRQHLSGVMLLLGVMLLGMLGTADILTMRMHGHALSRELRALEAYGDTTKVPDYDLTDASDDERGQMLLDINGQWRSLVKAGSNTRIRYHTWEPAVNLSKAGELRGQGHLPWTPELVVWAARVVKKKDDSSAILVSWDSVHNIRESMIPVYLAFLLATLLSFGISMALTLRTTRFVTHVLDAVATSSTRMAAGDYRVRLPEQSTRELDRVTSAINSLAHDLATVTADLKAEHTRLMRLEGLQRKFVADASHELRAPLTAMRVALEAWQDGMLRPEELPEIRTKLLHDTERLGALVTRLLDLSRIESGRETVTLEPIDVNTVSSEIADRFSSTSGAPIEINIPKNCPRVYADYDALYRILQNLLENARRFTDETGGITIWAQHDGGLVRIGVTDTGTGISPEELPRIWDRFSHSTEARALGKAGSGLGLAIVKALAEAMGGSVHAESQPGKSTAIWVQLRTPAAAKLTAAS